MLRRFDYGLVTTLGVALLYGLLYGLVQLSWGLVAVGLFGGWLIGVAIRRGVATALLRQYSDESAPEGGSVRRPWPRGTTTMGVLFGLLAWFVGNYVAFALIQLIEGAGPPLERLTPGNFAAFMSAISDPPLLQAAILAAFVVVAGYSARAPVPKPPRGKRR